MTLTVKPLDNIGVEIQGFDITQPWDDELQQQLRALWYEHGVLVFRNQAITPNGRSPSVGFLVRWSCTRSRQRCLTITLSCSSWKAAATRTSR